jgi:very-short-patch-repair endonuclease
MAKIPKALSEGEEQFALHCKIYKLKPEREYVFAAPRKWAFDFAWPEKKIAVEIEGGTAFGKSRHSRGEGFEKDVRKYNAAALLGWRVLRFTTAMVVSGEAIDSVRVALA